MGQVTTHQDFTLSNGSRERNVILPSGATSLSTETSAEQWTSVSPDGTLTVVQQVPDPQLGMLAAYDGTTTRTTPGGLLYRQTRTRTASGSPLAPTSIQDLLTVNGQSAPWSSTYSGATRQWLYVSPANRQRLEQLDPLGRISSISYPATTTLPTLSYTYDAEGRVQLVTLTANGGGATRTTSMTYDTFLAGYLAT